VATFLVRLRQAGPEFDHSKRLEEQTGWAEHAAFMDSLVAAGTIVLGGTLPNGRTAHAMEASSEEEIRAIWRATRGTNRISCSRASSRGRSGSTAAGRARHARRRGVASPR
jgi:hypothetical protein